MTATASRSSAFVEASATVRASADRVYDLIADYRAGHPRIIPPKYFRRLEVERGGRGEGTVITYEMKLLGKMRKARASVSEPNPGRVLVETVEGHGIVTTFRVEPAGAFSSNVTISSVVPTRGGVLGVLERAMVRRLLAPIYRDELALINSVAVADNRLRRVQ